MFICKKAQSQNRKFMRMKSVVNIGSHVTDTIIYLDYICFYTIFICSSHLFQIVLYYFIKSLFLVKLLIIFACYSINAVDIDKRWFRINHKVILLYFCYHTNNHSNVTFATKKTYMFSTTTTVTNRKSLQCTYLNLKFTMRKIRIFNKCCFLKSLNIRQFKNEI